MATRKRDFSKRVYFPGTHGNPFDRWLSLDQRIQQLPAPVFAVLLLLLAAMPGLFHGSWSLAMAMAAFLFGDWALLAALPRRGVSFGPEKPPALLLAFMRLPFALLPLPFNIPLQAIGTALVIYGFWIEPQRLGLTRQSLRSPKLNGSRPLRLLHLADLHAEIALTSREQQLLRMVREAQPDLIVFSGDFLNLSYLHDPRAQAAARHVLAQLDAPLGVYAVTGSPAVDLPEVVSPLIEGLPNLRWLRDECVTIHHDGHRLHLVGLTCSHKPFLDAPRLSQVVNGATPEAFTVLLYHTPDLAPEAAEAGVDLQLSGHTHGGQVRLPLLGALYAGSLYGKRYEMGRLREGDMTLYVARGIGLEGKGAPRVRFLCPPEIVLWELCGDGQVGAASHPPASR
jgi:uncharacterized protein